MGKRKNLVRRETNGKPQRARVQHREQALPPPTETRRLMDAAVAGMRPAEWGTMLGRLYLAGRISETQYAAGRRWCRIIEEYAQATQAPRAPRTAALDPSGGASPDPDTASGAREVRRHARKVEDYESSIQALWHAGAASVRVVEAVCERDLAPVGFTEVEALRAGLQMLAAFWSTQGQRAKVGSTQKSGTKAVSRPSAIVKP